MHAELTNITRTNANKASEFTPHNSSCGNIMTPHLLPTHQFYSEHLQWPPTTTPTLHLCTRCVAEGPSIRSVQRVFAHCAYKQPFRLHFYDSGGSAACCMKLSKPSKQQYPAAVRAGIQAPSLQGSWVAGTNYAETHRWPGYCTASR